MALSIPVQIAKPSFIGPLLFGDSSAGTATEQLLPTADSYAIFFGTLGAVLIIALVWTRLQIKYTLKDPGADLFVARNSQPWWALASSFFSSCMGSWVISGPAEIGQYYGWYGVIGYAIACGFPWWFMAVFGPRMRRLTINRGFCCTDLVSIRLNLWMAWFYMLVMILVVEGSLIAELTTIGGIFVTISPGVSGISITLSILAITYIYTYLGGARSSFLTDRLQAVVITLMIIIGASVIFPDMAQKLDSSYYHGVANWTTDGLVAGFVLIISCWYPTFSDPSEWNRIYAGRTVKDVQIGLMTASFLVIFPMIFFGVCGMMAQAAVNQGILVVTTEDIAQWDPFFGLLSMLPSWISGLMLAAATCMSSSTVDSYISGLTSTFLFLLEKNNVSYNWARFFATLLCIPAAIIAVINPPSVMTIFMIFNLLVVATSPPMLCSLWLYCTPSSAGCGIIGGILTICAFGWGWGDSFKSGFTWWLLPDGYDVRCLMTFLVGGIVSGSLTILVALIEFWIWPSIKEEQIKKFQLLKQQPTTLTSDETSQKVALDIVNLAKTESQDSVPSSSSIKSSSSSLTSSTVVEIS